MLEQTHHAEREVEKTYSALNWRRNKTLLLEFLLGLALCLFFVVWGLGAQVKTNHPNQLLLGGQVGEGGGIALRGGKWERSISGEGLAQRNSAPVAHGGGQWGTDCMITLSSSASTVPPIPTGLPQKKN